MKLSAFKKGIKLLRAYEWMPWCQQAMKDVISCDKPRRAARIRFDPEISEWGNLCQSNACSRRLPESNRGGIRDTR